MAGHLGVYVWVDVEIVETGFTATGFTATGFTFTVFTETFIAVGVIVTELSVEFSPFETHLNNLKSNDSPEGQVMHFLTEIS